ncbi:unnamed protein product [Nippostrongylus brasiliensis]|uniref:Uncharacterized protein n=1 Tax=Nippostrongylus brasiliensis TaxID=27835 RepID=A0A0N4Y2P4_NIPBR|nr:unnamed protein product [Nippostrongylus brasiliensis]
MRRKEEVQASETLKSLTVGRELEDDEAGEVAGKLLLRRAKEGGAEDSAKGTHHYAEKITFLLEKLLYKTR